ncbi:MAG: retroviral-like aspartic protease family protein [Gammaproteobacteria bacterium]|nr:retroviral-like aspartic protease family protein [Gammaproteobacteria bacterium]
MNRISIILLLSVLISPAINAEEDITILGLFKNRVIFKFNGKQYSMSPGDSNIQGIHLISADSEGALFELNGQQHHYSLGGHIGSSFRDSQADKVVTIAPDSQGMYFVNGTINKHHARFVVDTGATLISMNKNEARRFGIDYKLTGQEALTNTASGTETVYVVTLKTVRVGDIELMNITAAVHDSDFPNVILLGNSFLNQVSIQREGKLLQLRR